MTIATRFPESWAVPKFDIKTPSLVLYAPLWYPDSETTGSTIVSKDINRHSSTVTGATWGVQGRTFNGTSDNITFPTSLVVGTKPQTIIIWIYHTNTQNDLTRRPILGAISGDNQLTLGKFSNDIFYAGLYDGVGEERVTLNSNSFNELNNAWVMITLGNPATGNTTLYFNDTLKGTGGVGTAFTGTNLTLGYALTPWDGSFAGRVGELLIYNRTLDVSEIRRIYQVTKWRYK